VACWGGVFGYTYDFAPTTTIEELALISALENGLLDFTGADSATQTSLRTLTYTLRAPVGIAIAHQRRIVDRSALYTRFHKAGQ